MKPDLRSALRERILIGDGAMGTYLYQKGFPVGISYEELNLTNPDVIGDLHRQYYEAGARVIETNTFTANRENLAKYGLEAEVEAINRAGVQIAKKHTGDDAYILGAVGSIQAGRKKDFDLKQIRQDYLEQIGALLAEQVDGLLLETFFDLTEMRLVLRLVRDLTDIPVICQFAVEDSGRTQDGVLLKEAFQILQDEGADVVGFNCRSGPKTIMRLMETVQGLEDLPLSAFPNAGIPDYIDGEYTYMATPEYFASSAKTFADLGAKIVGGCCGTTPDHIRSIKEALKTYEPTVQQAVSQADRIVVSEPHASSRKWLEQKQQETILDTVKKRHTVIVELDPPRDLSIDKFLEGSEALKKVHVDALTMADNSLAMTRMSNMALGAIIKRELNMRPLIHMACRDRNLIGTQSHMMGLHALGINHVLAVTGDPAKFGDLPGSSSVYDTTSFEIIRMIKQLNEGIAFSGKPLKQKANFIIGTAFNPNVRNLDRAVKRLERKISAGAHYVMTQPVYDPKLIEEVYEVTKHLEVPVFIGVFPLASEANAEFLHNEVPGIQLSDETRERMKGLRGPEGKAMGVQIAKELLDTAMNYFKGIYIMTPFLAYEMSVELTRYVWEKTGQKNNVTHLS